ncbi:MAG TPA: hypothetical protein VH040_04740, partial [Usitatibacter sp.]|nr:hypothetical protein [Usitatibacter sp.]
RFINPTLVSMIPYAFDKARRDRSAVVECDNDHRDAWALIHHYKGRVLCLIDAFIVAREDFVSTHFQQIDHHITFTFSD